MSDLETHNQKNQNQKNQNHASFESPCLITAEEYLYTRNLSLDRVFVVLKQKIQDFLFTIQEFEDEFLDSPFTYSYRCFTFLLSTRFVSSSSHFLTFEVKIEETQGVTRSLKMFTRNDKYESLAQLKEEIMEKMESLMKRKTITKLVEEEEKSKENEQDKKKRKLNENEY